MPPERIGDGADIGPRADGGIEGRDAVSIRDDVERVDTRAPQRHVDDDPLAVQAIRALTADLDGRGRWDRQLDIATEALEQRLERLAIRGFVAPRAAPPRDLLSSSAA